MNIQEINEKKSLLRAHFKGIRLQLLPEDRSKADEKIYQNVINSMSYKYAQTVLLYASCKGEVDTWKIFEKALSDGKKCAFPKTYKDGTMGFYYVSSKDDLKSGNFAVPEPLDTLLKVENLNETTLCLVPCLGADFSGFRLGYGKGFYDKYLKNFKGISAILQYEECMSKTPLPMQKRYDIKADLVITQKKVYVIG